MSATEKIREGFYLGEDGEWIPDGWVETSLGAISPTKQYGYTESASKDEVGPKFLRITDIQNDFVDWDAVPYCPISESNLNKYSLEIGDLLIARTGNSTGAVTTIKDQINAVFASYLIRFKPDEQKVRHEFLDFLTRSRIWTSFVNSVKKGSAQGGANANDFAAFPIKLPSLLEQKAIADVLGSLDDKIELLREQNVTLESLAQTLFKRWFIDFNFPDENGNPYKDSGGEIIASELGEIPAGWSENTLTQCLDVMGGGTPKTSVGEYWDGEYFFFTPKDANTGFYCLATEKSVTKAGIDNSSTKLFPKNTIFVTARGTVGKTALALIPMAMNQSCYALKEKNGYNLTGFLLLREAIHKLQKYASGGVFDAITTSTLDSTLMVYPDKKMVQQFEQTVSPIFGKIAENSIQIQTLTQFRDTLLPKLMKGEIRVVGE